MAFDFWGLEALEAKGRKGIYELRSYTLKVRCREREKEREREREREKGERESEMKKHCSRLTNSVMTFFIITAWHFD